MKLIEQNIETICHQPFTYKKRLMGFVIRSENLKVVCGDMEYLIVNMFNEKKV